MVSLLFGVVVPIRRVVDSSMRGVVPYLIVIALGGQQASVLSFLQFVLCIVDLRWGLRLAQLSVIYCFAVLYVLSSELSVFVRIICLRYHGLRTAYRFKLLSPHHSLLYECPSPLSLHLCFYLH